MKDWFLQRGIFDFENKKKKLDQLNLEINKKGLEHNLSKVKVVLHSQDNREHDILDSDDYYQFQGGLISAIKKTSGVNPQAYFADNSRYQRPRIRNFCNFFANVIHCFRDAWDCVNMVVFIDHLQNLRLKIVYRCRR